MEPASYDVDEHANLKLPPGFRFDPTDEQLVLYFLYRRASSHASPDFHPLMIPDLHPCAHDPWDLDGKALNGRDKWYFYSKLDDDIDRERETGSGYWRKQEDMEDEAIFSSSGDGKKEKQVGLKRSYVFFIGEGIQTSWVLEEFHLCSSGYGGQGPNGSRNQSTEKERWVLCRVMEMNNDEGVMEEDSEVELSSLDELFLSFDHEDDDDHLQTIDDQVCP